MNLFLRLAKISSPKKIALGILILFLTIFLPLHFCSAAWWDSILNVGLGLPSRIIVAFLLSLILVIGLVLSIGVYLAAVLLGWVTGPDFLGGHFTTGLIVDAGLAVVQPLANVLILIAILIIGIATIMRIESYGMRRLLLPLIVVALLLNFVPTLMGFIVDGANFLIHFFIDPFIKVGGFTKGVSTFGQFWKVVADGFKNIIDTGNLAEFWDFTIQTLAPVINGAIITIFIFILIIILIAFCLIFIARYFVLWILTILSPLAVAAYILPFTKEHFDKWKNLFIQWTIIGIVAAFFLWLSMMVMNQAKDLVENQGRMAEEFTSRISTDDLTPSGASLNQTFAQLLNPSNPDSPLFQLLPYFIGLVFMVIAFITTLATSSMITSVISKGFGQISGWAKGTLKTAGGIGGAIAKTVAPAKYEAGREKTQRAAAWGAGMMGRLGRYVPGLGESRARQWLEERGQVKNAVEGHMERAKTFASPSLAQDILKEAPSPATTAKLLTLTERGEMGELYKAQEQREQRRILRERRVRRLEDLPEDQQEEVKTQASEAARSAVDQRLIGSLRIADQAEKLTEIRRKAPHLALVYQKPGESREEALQTTMSKIRTSDIKDLDTRSFEGDEGEEVIAAALRQWGREHFLEIARTKRELQRRINEYIADQIREGQSRGQSREQVVENIIGSNIRGDERLIREGWNFGSPAPGAEEITVPPERREGEEPSEQAGGEGEEASEQQAGEAGEGGETRPDEGEEPPRPGDEI